MIDAGTDVTPQARKVRQALRRQSRGPKPRLDLLGGAVLLPAELRVSVEIATQRDQLGFVRGHPPGDRRGLVNLHLPAGLLPAHATRALNAGGSGYSPACLAVDYRTAGVHLFEKGIDDPGEISTGPPGGVPLPDIARARPQDGQRVGELG